MDMGKTGDWATSSLPPIFTTGDNSTQTPKSEKVKSNLKQSSTCAKYQGWSIEGIRKFNFFFDAVKLERESTAGEEFEDALLQYSKDYMNNSKKKSVKEPVEYESCRHELWPEEVTAEAQVNAKGKEIEVNNDYPMFGVRKDFLENNSSKEINLNAVEIVIPV